MENYQSRDAIPLSLSSAKNMVSWAKFIAIMDIIFGAISCLGIITAVYGVPKIISGANLLNAAKKLRQHLEEPDPDKISGALDNLHDYFKLNGITVIINIVTTVAVILFYVYAIYAIINNLMESPGRINDLPYYFRY